MKPILFNTPMVQAILSGTKTTTRRVVRKKYSNTDLTMFTNKYGTRLIERQNDAPEPVEFIGEDGEKRTRRSLVACIECKPQYQPGDVIYVRETWGICGFDDDSMAMSVTYKADDSCAEIKLSEEKYQKYYDGMSESEPDWHPSIFMPKEAARLFLRVTDVRAERLQDITEDGAKAEGAAFTDFGMYTPDWKMSTDGGKTFNQAKERQRNGWNCGEATGPEMCFPTARGAFAHLWGSTVKKPDLSRYGWEANPWVWVYTFQRCEKEA